MDSSEALALFGTDVVLVGTVITGVGLFVGWRRALARYSRRARELRAALEKPKHYATGASLTVTAGLPAAGTVDPDAPVSRQHLEKVIESLRKEIESVSTDISATRTAVAAAIASGVTDEGVEATARGILSEHEHRENKTALGDLSCALVGISIQAVGTIITLVGLIV